MFQANQSYGAVASICPWLSKPMYGIILVVLVGIVIVGGIKRIASVAEKIVPLMCGIYILSGIFILLYHFTAIPSAVVEIISSAFSNDAVAGGALGSLVIGFRRAAFSNEAGIGTAPIAHAAAKTEEPVREGVVAAIGPFVDTILICTMSGLVITVTGAWNAEGAADIEGIAMTSRAFASVLSWFPYVLSFSAVLFAFSTMISYSYYGERCWEYLFGQKSVMAYKALFLVFTFVGCVVSIEKIKDYADVIIFCMVFINITGCLVLCPKVKEELNQYWDKYRRGEFKTYK